MALGEAALTTPELAPGNKNGVGEEACLVAPRLLGPMQETAMRDVADAMPVSMARLTRELDEHECRRRNALSKSIPGFALSPGEVGTVLETLGNNEAFLVEFSRNGEAMNGECDWLGVLYPTEIEVVEGRVVGPEGP
jgi:hypothetical protein